MRGKGVDLGYFQSFAARSIVLQQRNEPSDVTQQGVPLGYADLEIFFSLKVTCFPAVHWR